MAASSHEYHDEHKTKSKYGHMLQQVRHGDTMHEAPSDHGSHAATIENAASRPGVRENLKDSGGQTGPPEENTVYRRHKRRFWSSFEHAFFKSFFSRNMHSQPSENEDICDAQALPHGSALPHDPSLNHDLQLKKHQDDHAELAHPSIDENSCVMNAVHNAPVQPSLPTTSRNRYSTMNNVHRQEGSPLDDRSSTPDCYSLGHKSLDDQDCETQDTTTKKSSLASNYSHLLTPSETNDNGLQGGALTKTRHIHSFKSASSSIRASSQHMANPKTLGNHGDLQTIYPANPATPPTDTLIASNSSLYSSHRVIPESLASHSDASSHVPSRASPVLGSISEDKYQSQRPGWRNMRRARSTEHLAALIESRPAYTNGSHKKKDRCLENTSFSINTHPEMLANHEDVPLHTESSYLPLHVAAFHASRKAGGPPAKQPPHRRRQTVCLSSNALSELDLNLENSGPSAKPKDFNEDVCRDFINLQLGYKDRVPILYQYAQGIDEVRQRLILRFGDVNYSRAMGIFNSIMRDGHNSGFGDEEDIWQSWRFSFLRSGVSPSVCSISRPKALRVTFSLTSYTLG